ncbi:hypothetical protein [Erythrobacter phage vB_EliS-L02]|nr:hypothetical protein [Erythrobacter phage vB_EliS-L02]
MIDFYLDTEFSNFGGWLISLALVHDRDDYLYLVSPDSEIEASHADAPMDPWVRENVLPILFDVPRDVLGSPRCIVAPRATWGHTISQFIYGRTNYPHIICDWPDDLRYLTELLVTGPGQSVPMERRTAATIVRHIDVYPTTLEGAVQHNAWWDALATRQKVMEY